MKKIINWTFGSVFRTIGRFLGFGIIILVFSLIMSKNDIKITDLLGINYVFADTITPWNTIQVRFAEDIHGTETWTSYYTATNYTYTPSYPLKSIQWRLTSSSALSRENTYTFDFAYRPTPDSISVSSYYISTGGASDKEDITCETTTGSTGFVHFNCTFTPRNTISAGSYLYARIIFNESYLTQIETRMTGYEERKGTNAIITEQTNNIINNNIQNTQDIINNQNTNTEDIINSLTNASTQIENGLNSLEESQIVCQQIDRESIEIDGKFLDGYTGNLADSNSFGVTKYINILNTKIKIKKEDTRWLAASTCFYNDNKVKISCIPNNELLTGTILSIPINAKYIRVSIEKSQNIPVLEICKNGNQALQEGIHGLAEGIHDNDTTEATNSASNFFTNFSTNTHGLTSIITSPLNSIISLSSSTCTPLHLPLPYMENKYLDLPCMRVIYDENFGDFMDLYDLITFGIVSYWIIVRIFSLVKDFKNPYHDEIEVVDL